MRKFLGESDQGTVILIKKNGNHTLPTLKKFREIFDIQGGSIYQSHGWYSSEIDQLQLLLTCSNANRSVSSDYKYYSSDYYFYADQKLPANAMYLSAYLPVTLDGFNLTSDCMEDLRKLLQLHYFIEHERDSVHHFIQSIRSVPKRSSQRGLTDPTMLSPDLNALQRIFQGYGDVAYKNICIDLQNWRDTYRWKL